MRAEARDGEFNNDLNCSAGHYGVDYTHAAVIDVPEGATAEEEGSATSETGEAPPRAGEGSNTKEVGDYDGYDGCEDGNHGVGYDGDELGAFWVREGG